MTIRLLSIRVNDDILFTTVKFYYQNDTVVVGPIEVSHVLTPETTRADIQASLQNRRISEGVKLQRIARAAQLVDDLAVDLDPE